MERVLINRIVLIVLFICLNFTTQANSKTDILVCDKQTCQTVPASFIYTQNKRLLSYLDDEGERMVVESCSGNHCRPIESVEAAALEDGRVTLFQSIKASQTLLEKEKSARYFGRKPNAWFWHQITIHPDNHPDVHPIIGFGGAFSDTASLLYQAMSPDLKKALIASYYGEDGIAYSLGRVPMASSDFSCRAYSPSMPSGLPGLNNCSAALTQYSYADESPGSLDSFALQPEDTDYKIPMIKAAMATLKQQQKPLALFASPWSAPAWMKTNESMVHGGLLPEYRSLWADYFIRFLEAYRERGIEFWGVTVQNEPVEEGFLGTKDLQTWQTMYSNAEEQALFIEQFLGPNLREYNHTTNQDVKLIVHDDQVSTIGKRLNAMMKTGAAKFIDGAGLHWYMNNLIPMTDDYPKLDKAFKTLNASNDKPRFILGTEACEGYLTGVPGQTGPKLGDWRRGEAYASDIISDLNHHVSGWTDWNLMLDMKGGPNWANNFVDAPILVDIEKQTFYRQPMYYYMGHFSKFILPGSTLLRSDSTGPAPIEEVVFQVPETPTLPSHTVIVVLNRDFTKRHYLIEDKRILGENRYLDLVLPAHGIQTIIYKSS